MHARLLPLYRLPKIKIDRELPLYCLRLILLPNHNVPNPFFTLTNKLKIHTKKNVGHRDI